MAVEDTDRCGFEYENSNPYLDRDSNCCVRETWRDYDRCIWHADVPADVEKPVDELRACRETETNRRRNAEWDGFAELLQGSGLDGVKIVDSLSLANCQLREADLSEAYLRRADLSEADLRDADLSEAYLESADLSEANLFDADLSEADLRDADLSEAYLLDADLSEANLPITDLSEADLPDTDLSDADATDTTFHRANLQNALLVRTDCRGANFTDALLFETVFSDTRINSQTTFADTDDGRPTCVYETDPDETGDELPEDTTPLDAAQWTYNRLEQLHEDNALSERARQFHVSKEEAERTQYNRRGNPRFLVKTVMWLFTKHGESVRRTLAWWVAVIGVSAGLFPLVGGVEEGGTQYAITSLSEFGTGEAVRDLLFNAYFSVITFSTIGYGGLSPAAPGSRALVAVESTLGALLVALLVFVLGRRVAR